ncbi:MAG: GNAT family N-acetyltransferase [Chitinophagaceae bacterium]|nr:GNAT family N-acetyltransferase [Chitinophagaceae bacterium]
MDISEYKIVKGDFVELHEITPDDAQIIYNWRTSSSGQFMNQPDGYSLESQQNWMQNRPANEINYTIISKESGQKVGMIAIVGISIQDKNAEVGRLLLAPEFLKASNPSGLEALKICYNLILNVWGFNKIYGNVLSENKPMLKMQKYLGMVEEGLLKQQKNIHGKMYDLHLVAIFQEQFNKSYLPKIQFLLKAFRKQ